MVEGVGGAPPTPRVKKEFPGEPGNVVKIILRAT